jgi:hypothetical protein
MIDKPTKETAAQPKGKPEKPARRAAITVEPPTDRAV